MCTWRVIAHRVSASAFIHDYLIHCFQSIVIIFVSRPELLTEQVKQEMPSIPVCDPGMSWVCPVYMEITEESHQIVLCLFQRVMAALLSCFCWYSGLDTWRFCPGKSTKTSQQQNQRVVLFTAQWNDMKMAKSPGEKLKPLCACHGHEYAVICLFLLQLFCLH